ncbi:unnamed protein product, partial [Symbiodinium sp. CCMP2456]
QEAVLDLAWRRLPEDSHDTFRRALQRPSRAKAAVAERQAKAAEAQAWSTLLTNRVTLDLPQPEDAERVFHAKTADDDRRLRSKFGAWTQARDAGEEDWRSTAAMRFERWCGHYENSISGPGPSKNTVRKCNHCRAGIGYPTVATDCIPRELQGLSLEALWALRPLAPDVGKPVWARHGYRVHTDMIRFWWRPQPVLDQIASLALEADRDKASAAYHYLMESTESAYGHFVAMRAKFLHRTRARRTGAADDRLLQLPRRVLEEEGLECAVWPHLYPRTVMCETHVRKADERRQGRATAQHTPLLGLAPENSDSDASDCMHPADLLEDGDDPLDELEADAPLDFARAGRNSAKSAYLAKVLGPTLGYGADFELFQFVYDLWLWSTLGAKKNAVAAPLRLAMAGYSFSPE